MNRFEFFPESELYLTQNDPKRSSAVLSEIRDTTSRGKDIESKSLSEVKITPVKPLSNTQDYNNPRMKKKRLMSRISSLWGRFQKKSRLKLSKQDFNFKLRGKFR